jgi:hypothetical protein
MKKLFGIIMTLFISIALTACGKQEAPEATNPPANTPTFDNNVAQPANTVKENTAAAFASIQDAMTKSIPLKCSYTDKDGTSMTMYIKGKLMRVIGTQKVATDPLINEIIKDNMIYVWSDKSDQGFLIDIAKNAASDSPIKMNEKPVTSSDDIANEVNSQIQNCATEDVADSMFEVPTNIKFLGGLQ